MSGFSSYMVEFFTFSRYIYYEFLRKRGYTVLNLIEVRKPYKDEMLTQTITVGDHEFDY